MKVYKVNKAGSLAACIPKEIQALGYVAGVEFVWEVKDGVPTLKKVASSPPVEKVALATCQPTEAVESPINGV